MTGVDPSAPLARANPLAKLAVALLLSVVLLLSVDPVTAATALALMGLALPWCGLSARRLLVRLAPVLAAAVPAGITVALLGADAGAVLASLGPVSLTQGSLTDGAAVAARVLAVGGSGVVLLATTDPTDLADALTQQLRLPATFVLGALAATRLVDVLAEEWSALGQARRARGVGGDGPAGWVRTVGGQVFALLVLAVRRGVRLALAMEARGFGVRPDRTSARVSAWSRADAVVLVGGAALAAAATVAGVAAGTWRLVLT